MSVISRSDLLAFRDLKRECLEDIVTNPEWGEGRPWDEFILGMSILASQSYGHRCARRLANHFGLSKSFDVDRGDYVSKRGKYYEVKCSIIQDHGNQRLNMVQLRPWQDVDYIFGAFDASNFSRSLVFMLTKQEVLTEMPLLHATPAHGTKKANLDNDKIEYRMDLLIKSSNQHCKRWLSSYRVDPELL